MSGLVDPANSSRSEILNFWGGEGRSLNKKGPYFEVRMTILVYFLFRGLINPQISVSGGIPGKG